MSYELKSTKIDNIKYWQTGFPKGILCVTQLLFPGKEATIFVLFKVCVQHGTRTEGESRKLETQYNLSWDEEQYCVFYNIVNRPSVAGAVLQTPLSLIN